MLIISIYKSINQSIIHSIIQPFIHSITQPFLRSVVFFLFLSMTILLFGCKQTTEPKLEAELKLELEDASCTEAWIKLTTTNLQLPATLNLLQDGNLSETINLLGADTVLYVDSLLPNQTYKFQASIQPFNHSGLPAEGRHSSNELTVTTMDTTSHDFSWQSWEFGQHSSSTLYDVAIIDENNIWAVGEIYMLDSVGNPDPNAYNAVHWDGTKWELKKIGGQGGWACHTVFAFSANDIWFEGNIHWNGSTYTAHMNGWPLMPNGDGWQVNKMWGSSSEDLYAVGNNGNIAHWDGVKWTKIESGTDLHIYDIWGDYNEKTGQWEILAVAANVYNSLEKEVIKIKNSQSYKLSNFGIEEPLRGVWFKVNRKYYLVGSGTYMKTFLTENEWKGNPRDITNYFENAIRANSTNDVIVVGAFGEVLHFNGYSWKSFINQTYLPSGTYLSVDVKGNILVAVGWNSRQAIITTGRK